MKTSNAILKGLACLALAVNVMAEQSSITEADGYACMGDDKSRKDTESAALADAKRNAMEFSKTYIQSESQLDNFELKKDLVEAFARADVKVITILQKDWQSPDEGDCYTIRIKAEVVPRDEDMQRVSATANLMEDPRAPLNVSVWTNQETFTAGEAMKIYVRGNKPFYGRLIYVDAEGTSLQLLPNPYRTENYFQGGVIFEIPQGNDKFDLTVQPPFGSEKLVFYASTSPLGELSTADAGAVYKVDDAPARIAAKTRGIAISNSSATTTVAGETKKKKVAGVSEFAEASVEITTSED